MDVVTLPVPQLGNRCHLVHDGRLGLVVDPPRDHTLVEQAAADTSDEGRTGPGPGGGSGTPGGHSGLPDDAPPR